MGFDVTVKGFGSFTATVNGEQAVLAAEVHDASALLATMAAQGAKGDKGDTGNTGATGPQGPSGVVSATAPLAYDSGTKNLSIDLSAYATESWVDANYYAANNPDGFITTAALAPYETTSHAAATYYPLTNPAGYITTSALAGYATEAWVGSQGYLTSSALTPYLTISSASATYQPLSGMSAYYLASNPSGYITSSALTGYATESWVTSQGYLTSAPVTSVAGKTGAVTLAVADVSGAAPTASPTFTGDPKAPTPATSDNDTSIATTAFVNAYCPTASTSTAGKVQLATTAQAYAGTSGTVGVVPSGLNAETLNPLVFQSTNAWFGSAVSGTGGLAQTTPQALNLQAQTSAGATYALLRFVPSTVGIFGIGLGRSQFPFSKRVQFTFLLMRYNNRTDANTIFRATIGKIGTDNAGDLARAGIGIRWQTSGNIQLQVHNGTALTNVATTSAPGNEVATEVMVDSDGAGNVTLFINGTSVATTNAGPTADTAFQTSVIQFEVENTATPTNQFAVQTTLPRFKTGR